MQPNLFLILQKLCLDWLAFFGIITSRYFLICGGAHLLLYSTFINYVAKYNSYNKSSSWKTQSWKTQFWKTPSWTSIKKDMELSLLCAVIFSLCAALVVTAYDSDSTLLYTSINQYGLWYLGASFIGLLILQDTYFYFVHRLFHHPLLFKKFHYGHHRSKKITPWTSFAFDPGEAFIQAIFFVGIVFILPLHYIALFAALIVMTLWAVFNHIGFELFPSSFYSRWLGKWFIGSKHHLIHHRRYKLHYGLYFTFWDRLLGTQDPNYQNQEVGFYKIN
ncbi:MAG: sterol desaturase family protein [Cyanobacteria bacterium P01_A01_bin.84]